MLNGTGSFSDMSRSLIAAYKTSQTRTSKSNKSAQRILNPYLTPNVTPLTKELTKTPEAAIANSLPPRARETKRAVPRGVNPKIAIGDVHLVHPVGDKFEMSKPTVRDLVDAIESANISRAGLMDILPVLYRVVQRMYSKTTSISSAKNDGSGGHFSRRGRALAEYTSMQALAGDRYVPALLLFRGSSAGECVTDHIRKDKMQLGSIMEVLIFVKVSKDQSVADLEVLGDVFVVCKSCASGSFGGKSKLDIAVLFDLLSLQVWLHYSQIIETIFPLRSNCRQARPPQTIRPMSQISER